MNKEKRYTFQMQIEQEIQDAIEYLKKRGYSVSTKVKLFLLQLAEKDKSQEMIGKEYLTTKDFLSTNF